MEEPPKNALRVKIMEPFLNAGLFRAHIYPYGSVPYETRQFLQLTDEMKKESAKLRRLLSIPKENEVSLLYCIISSHFKVNQKTKLNYFSCSL